MYNKTMSEKLPYRREAAANEVEQTKQHQAMQYLVKVGIFKKAKDLDLFHGRAGDGTNTWRVDPSFDNSGNKTGNHNINKKPVLHTSNFDTAHQFSVARSAYTPESGEVYRIVSEDPDAVIVDEGSMSRFNDTELKSIEDALAATLPGITEGAPLDFDDRFALNHINPSAFRGKYGIMFNDEIEGIAKKLGLSQKTTERIGSAINTRKLIRHGNIRELCHAFKDNETSILVKKLDGTRRPVPISQEYLTKWFRRNHIIGYKVRPNSATISQEVEDYVLFDLEKINTDAEYGRISRERNRRYGNIVSVASKNSAGNHSSRLIEALTHNLYIKPKEIVELAKSVPGFKRVFEADAGNWEKYKLEEHTETVLRVFDHNFADAMPAAILPVMRMALLVHDLGKSEAVRRNDKANQKQYNIAAARLFLSVNKVDEPTTELITTMIGEGMDWSKRIFIDQKTDTNQLKQFSLFCENTMKKYLQTNQVDQGTVLGFVNMLRVLQTCDSAAYTTMAVTRGPRGYYRNFGVFNKSFEPFSGFTGDRARIMLK